MITYTLDELKQLKENFGLTYEEIQKNCSLSISTIQKAFRGINKHPRLTTLEELTKAIEKLLPGISHSQENAPPISNNLTSNNLTSNKEPRKVKYTFSNPDEEPTFLAEPSHYYSKGSSALNNRSRKSSSQEIYTQSGYTYDDYLKLELPEGKRIEIIDGVIYDMSAPTLQHQDITGFFYRRFTDFIEKNKGKCKAYISPVDVRLEFDTTDMTVVQPDVLVICDRAKSEDGKSIKGAPDFILEVLSPSSRKIDMNLKLKKYRESGVREYWIVDYDAGVVIKNIFDPQIISESKGSTEQTKIYTTSDVIPVEIYGGALKIDFNDVREYVES